MYERVWHMLEICINIFETHLDRFRDVWTMSWYSRNMYGTCLSKYVLLCHQIGEENFSQVRVIQLLFNSDNFQICRVSFNIFILQITCQQCDFFKQSSSISIVVFSQFNTWNGNIPKKEIHFIKINPLQSQNSHWLITYQVSSSRGQKQQYWDCILNDHSH